jgi:hypothetical protein
MFDSIFKRPAGTPSSTAIPTREQPADNRAAQIEAKAAALARADALTDDESLALAFILECEFAEARLKAAEHLRSKSMLESALLAVRNADRRVAKLLHVRLDALQRQEVWQQQAQQCVDDARRLAEESHLLPNQVADLDRAWKLIGIPPQAEQGEFEKARASLRDRLEAQAALQRSIMDILARLRATREAADGLAAADIANTLDSLEQEMVLHRASPEAPSLPKHLLPEFEQRLLSFKQMLVPLAGRQDATKARQEALERWEAGSTVALKEESLLRAWQDMPPLPEGEAQAALQARFDTLVGGAREVRQSKQAAVKEKKQDAIQHFINVLDGMEKALENGALHTASEQDKALRAIDLKSAKLSEAQSARVARVRSELGRLQSWAKWGGNISREELLKAAEGLPAQSLAALELAKKVGSLRERWKSLDISAGPSSKELWERFDAACTTAYAPAAEHFKKLADERHNNQAKAKAIIDEMRQFAISSNCAAEDAGAVDWKGIANFCLNTTQVWRRLGTIDRKEKKRLDAEFDLSLKTLSEPLARQRGIEIRMREKLIAQVNDLSPGDRSALDTLRNLQERWQAQAKSLPLARKDEQELWQRFRAACDAVFAKRKANAAAADADRQQQLKAKESVCVALEAAVSGPQESLAKMLREGKEAWSRIGPVPRVAEAKIEARYKTATSELQKHLDAAKLLAANAKFNALRNKMALCRMLEEALLDGSTAKLEGAEIWNAKWQALPVLSNEFERTMRLRFDAVLNAVQSNSAQYASVLQQNRAGLSLELLRLEIMAGIESPPECARERLKLQVELLQASLKAGQKPVTQDAQLLRLCAQAAPTDQDTAARIDRLVGNIKLGG